jgi:hypothetical protein
MPNTGTRQFPGGEFVAIVPTFAAESAAHRAAIAALPASMKRNFNDPLPMLARGLYVGGASGSVYNIWVRTSGNFLVPLLNMVPGIVHPVFPYREVVNAEGTRTSAINLLVIY